ncbi:hypothetical protein K488DRAFT_83011 [Vararia minispora EC-137]|uniref:Uncharacterized protein n=1 Tax=Vararia minispora EC-137 TaxID=1314806 RepID=A0ACB8QUZ1_9AGAM|nr:hypothetical protein K488DRAFT_83011 [Vararia minispora EC-137]
MSRLGQSQLQQQQQQPQQHHNRVFAQPLTQPDPRFAHVTQLQNAPPVARHGLYSPTTPTDPAPASFAVTIPPEPLIRALQTYLDPAFAKCQTAVEGIASTLASAQKTAQAEQMQARALHDAMAEALDKAARTQAQSLAKISKRLGAIERFLELDKEEVDERISLPGLLNMIRCDVAEVFEKVSDPEAPLCERRLPLHMPSDLIERTAPPPPPHVTHEAGVDPIPEIIEANELEETPRPQQLTAPGPYDQYTPAMYLHPPLALPLTQKHQHSYWPYPQASTSLAPAQWTISTRSSTTVDDGEEEPVDPPAAPALTPTTFTRPVSPPWMRSSPRYASAGTQTDKMPPDVETLDQARAQTPVRVAHPVHALAGPSRAPHYASSSRDSSIVRNELSPASSRLSPLSDGTAVGSALTDKLSPQQSPTRSSHAAELTPTRLAAALRRDRIESSVSPQPLAFEADAHAIARLSPLTAVSSSNDSDEGGNAGSVQVKRERIAVPTSAAASASMRHDGPAPTQVVHSSTQNECVTVSAPTAGPRRLRQRSTIAVLPSSAPLLPLSTPPPSTRKRRAPTSDSGKSQKRIKKKTAKPTAESEMHKKYVAASMLCAWPEKTSGDEKFGRSFVECDHCKLWYHVSCAGFAKDDKRMKDGVLYVCPPCGAFPNDRESVQDVSGGNRSCWRPDCHCPDAANAQDHFFVEKIVGRAPDYRPELGDFLWLVKWDGYPISQCTWERLGSPKQLIEAFEAVAAAEGLELRDTKKCLLGEAIAGGWHKKPVIIGQA